jgi:hypothetical protein
MNKQNGFILLEHAIASIICVMLIGISVHLIEMQLLYKNKIATTNSNILKLSQLRDILKDKMTCPKNFRLVTLEVKKDEITLECSNEKSYIRRKIFHKNTPPYKVLIKENDKKSFSVINMIKIFEADKNGSQINIKCLACNKNNTLCHKSLIKFKII